MDENTFISRYDAHYDNKEYCKLSSAIKMKLGECYEHTRIMNKIIDVSLALSGIDNAIYILAAYDLGVLTADFPDETKDKIIAYLNLFIDDPYQHGSLNRKRREFGGVS